MLGLVAGRTARYLKDGSPKNHNGGNPEIMNKINHVKLIAGVLITTLSHGLAAPVNDNYSNAIVLTGNSGTLSGNNTIDATLEVDEPECGYPGTNNTVWFKWVCTQAGSFSLSTTGSTNDASSEWDAVLCLYTGSTLATLSEVVKQDTGVPETVTVAVTPGTYYIQAGGYPNPPADVATNIVLNWSLVIPPPPNTAVVSIDVVRSGLVGAVSGDVAGSPVTGQTGPWNPLLGSSMPAPLTGLTSGAGAATGVGLNATFSGTTGFQASDNAAPAVLGTDNPERLWVTGTGSTLTLTVTGLTAAGNYGLVIYNTGSPSGRITINGSTTHTAVSKIFASSETADSSGNITAVVGFVGDTHSDYMEVSGLQVYPLVAPPTLTANAGADKTVTPGSPTAVIGGSPSASGGTGPYTYSWTPTTGLDDPTAANPTASPTVTTIYTLTLTDSLGTPQATDEVTVTFETPPAGSPNLVSVDVVRSDSIAASGDVTGGLTGQSGLWNRLDGGSMPATLSNLTNGNGGATTISLTATVSGTTGFQGGGSVTGVVLAGDSPERRWVTGDGSTLTLVFSGLNIGASYDLAIFNTGSVKGTITINGGTTHTNVPTILTASEVADPTGKITAVVSFVGDAHSDYMEVSGVQLKASGTTPSGYTTWADTYAGGGLAGEDYNNDGVQNGIAYFMGMNGLATHPGVVGGSVTWPYVNAVTSYKVQTSNDLSPLGWTDVLPGDPRLHDTGLGGSVTYDLLPPGPGRLFVRMVVTP